VSQADWVKKDYYATLGADKNASAADIKKAYRKLAQKYHPDNNAGNKQAEEKFKEISQANDVLSDPEKKQEYDRIRQMVDSGGFGGGRRNVRVEDVGDIFGGGGIDLDDILGGLFGGGGGRAGGGGFRRAPSRGNDLETEATIPFEEALKGATVELGINPPGSPRRTIKARIPAMVKDGDRIRLAGKGMPGGGGGPAGDLFVKVHVAPHRWFGRRGHDVTLQLPITFSEAALGAEVEVPTLNGKPVKLKVPGGTPSGKTFRVRGKGGPDGSKTDLLVTVNVAVPSKLSKEGKDLVRKLAEVESESPREHFYE